jgi:hypothetical protein
MVARGDRWKSCKPFSRLKATRESCYGLRLPAANATCEHRDELNAEMMAHCQLLVPISTLV